MRELIQQVMERADISEAAAANAVDAVLGYLREKLPAPAVTQIESLLGGEGAVSGESVVAGAKSMMGAFKKE
jgi:uncharacterized protein (DUF2267 family)